LAAAQADSGVTGLALALRAVLGTHTPESVRQDLERVPEKKAESWARLLLGQTVQWLRRRFFGRATTVEQPQPGQAVPNPG
jgi:hypothetical protein